MSITVETNEGIVQDAAEDATSEENTSEQGNENESESQEDESTEESDTQEDSEGSEENEEESQEGDGEGSEDSDESEDDPEEDNENDNEKEHKPKRRSGFKKRIDKLNKRISSRDSEIDFLRRQLDDRSREKPAEREEPTDDKRAQGDVNNYGLKKPVVDNYEDYNEYIEDLTEYKAKLVRAEDKAEAETERAKTEIVTRVKSFQDKSREMAKEINDFQEVISDVDDIKATPELQKALLEAEDGPTLMYELAKNPEEYRRVNQLSRSGIDRALGRLEAKVEMSKDPTSKTKKVFKKTKAPKPLGKVGTKGKGTPKSLYDGNLSQREFERLRQEQIKTKAY